MDDKNTDIDLDELLKDVIIPDDGSKSAPSNIMETLNITEALNITEIDNSKMLSKSKEAIGEAERDPSEVDLTITEFPEVSVFFSDEPHSFFDTADFYQKTLKGEGDRAQRLHTALTKYLTAKDPKDRTVFRQQTESAYWSFISELPSKIAAGNASIEQKYALRYGLLLPTLLSQEQKDMLAKVIDSNKYREAIYYLDEWFAAIGAGLVAPSSTDEVRVIKQDGDTRYIQLLEKANGRFQNSKNLLKSKSEEMLRYEEKIKEKISSLFTHAPVHGIINVYEPYTAAQKQGISQLTDMVKALLKLDKELSDFLSAYREAESDIALLSDKVKSSSGGNNANVSASAGEYETIRQMAKMSCGRKGNHFPILSREYFRASSKDVGTRENVLREMRWIESIDVQAYCRQYKTQMNRIPPFVILLPTYGDIGFCWEPFDRYNRVTSRGRIVIPMYSKSLRLSLLMATADLRWQVAKEKASYYWMEEGLTGNYYQWFETQNLKMDIKESFMKDYIIWMTKESAGIQKLDKEIRDVFWRYIPFTDKIKEKLKMQSWVYQELCQKDLNRQRSDGY